ncbi:MAG: STAS domain-containing protein [Patescibacteria group bacterium]
MRKQKLPADIESDKHSICFTLEDLPDNNHLIRVSLKGDLENVSDKRLKTAVDKIFDKIAKQEDRVIVDMTPGVDFVDTNVIAYLIARSAKKAFDRKIFFGVICNSGTIFRIFQITGLDRIFNVYTDDSLTTKASYEHFHQAKL